jgi:hypothetical protein
MADARRRQAALDALRKVKEREAGGGVAAIGGTAGGRVTLGEQLAAEEELNGPAATGVRTSQGGQGRNWRGFPAN